MTRKLSRRYACCRTVFSAFWLAVVACVPLSSIAADTVENPGQDSLATAARLVEESGVSGGMCAVVGATDAQLALAIAKQGRFQVHCLVTEADARDALRQAIRARGMYGTVSADILTDGRLPYTDNLINIAIVDARLVLADDGPSLSEVFRVLAPLGTAFSLSSADEAGASRTEQLTRAARALGVEDPSVVDAGGTWVRMQKPWPEAIDEWTHYLHGADGNPVAQDLVVGPPRHYQWISGPLWQRSHETDSNISSLVTARGRLFAIVDEAPIGLAGNHPLPDKWFLQARDAFNGVPLWKVPIRRWGWREWKGSWFNTRPGDIPLNIQKRLVAVEDKVYVTLGYQAPVSQLDARTGEILQTYDGTERTGEILYLDGTLILSVLADRQVKVMAVDARTGRQQWITDAAYRGSTVDYIKWKEMHGGIDPPPLDPSLNIAADGTVVALIDGPDIVAIDFLTGELKWRAPFPEFPQDRTAGGINSQGNLWIGTMIVHDGVVLHASPNGLAAFSADKGQLLWTQPKKYIGHLWYEWKDVFVIGGLVWTWSAELEEEIIQSGQKRQRALYPRSINGYDLQTGQLQREVPVGNIYKTHHHHRCYRNKATPRYVLSSRRGTEFVDLEHGQHTVHNWVRGTCHLGMMPANGLQYAPPHPCQCYIDEKLNGLNALAPAGLDERALPDSGDRPVLERGEAYGRVTAGEAADEDWPEFRHDAMRTGSVKTRLSDAVAPLWRTRVGAKVSPPVVAAGKLFAALVDEHQIVCLDTQDGKSLWEFAAGARIDSPPTYYRGTVLFGSADGWVYCVRADDGRLVWRFRAAPAERLIGAFGQLESAWPVHGSVLVLDGTVYFAAGRSSQLDGGIFLYGLDAETGAARYRTHLSGPDYNVDNFEVNYQLPMGALPDILLSDGTNIYMRAEAFNVQLERQRGSAPLKTPAGFLDDSYFKRTPWTYQGGDYARLIVSDERSVYHVRMFDTLRALDPTVFFTPGSKGYLLFAKDVGSRQNRWSSRIPVRIRAMVLAGDRLVVAGPPDVIDPRDPLGAFEGRLGGRLHLFDAATGEELAKQETPSPPVFNGAAAARGRLYVSDEQGGITCFGEK